MPQQEKIGIRFRADGNRADLGHAMVVVNAGLPFGFDTLADFEDAAAGLAADDDFRDAQRRDRELDFFAHLGEAQGVGGCAAEDGGFAVTQQLEPVFRGKPATGDGADAHSRGGFEARPEAEERAEGEREKGDVARLHACAAPDPFPVVEDPCPVAGIVEPDEGLAAGAAGLVEAVIAGEREGVGGAVGRVLFAVGGEFVLGGERDAPREIGKAGERSNHSEFFGVETVRREDGADQIIEFLELGRHRSYRP